MTTTVGEWVWTAANSQLKVDVTSGKPLSILSGTWVLSDFGRLLDGLSQRRIEHILEAGQGSVACELNLANGERVQFIGAFTGDDARGMLLSGTQSVAEGEHPGPELVPVFQPILSLITGDVVGFEALARWPSEGAAGAGAYRDFDDKALASNMLIHACEAISTIRAAILRQDVFMQVNLVSEDLMDDGLIDLVSALISGHDLSSGQLRLELTEQAALRNTERAIEVSHALCDVGAGLVLDDFGSGHSSFLWLADLPAHSLKIDSQLIAQIHKDRVRTILEVVCLMAKRLNMTVTAEGVEQNSIVSVLREIGFDYAQGFALGRPMRLPNVLKFLAERGERS